MRYDPRTRLEQGPIGSQVSQWTNLSFIKSVQTGTIEMNGVTSNTAPITAVNLSNSVLMLGGISNASVTNQANQVGIRITLTSTTVVTATRPASEAVSCLVRYTVVEFVPNVIKQIQRFPSKDINGGTSTTQALTTVNVNKSHVVYLGTTYASANDTAISSFLQVAVTLTTGILATLTCGTNPGAACLTSFDVIERY